MSMLERAIQIAVEAHAGQKDKAGRPYILHPLRVMGAMSTDEERAVAVLHDVLEDTDILLLDMHDRGIPMNVIDAVDALTRRRRDTYDDYLARVAKDPIARRVKIADLKDNMDLSRLPNPGTEDFARQKKYQRALSFLDLLSQGREPNG